MITKRNFERSEFALFKLIHEIYFFRLVERVSNGDYFLHVHCLGFVQILCQPTPSFIHLLCALVLHILEMGISSLLKNGLFQGENLPLRFAAISRCYRPEISKNAAESKLYRVHEFTKVSHAKALKSRSQLRHANYKSKTLKITVKKT